jgi:hypothetical protein
MKDVRCHQTGPDSHSYQVIQCRVQTIDRDHELVMGESKEVDLPTPFARLFPKKDHYQASRQCEISDDARNQ